MTNLAGRAIKRLVLEGLGWLLLLAGLAALVLPGPGLLLIFVAMVLLSKQYEWANKRLEFVRHRAMLTAAEGVNTLPRVALSCLGALSMVAFGVLWIVGPDVPDWWSLPERLWLPGGLTAGITLVASGLIALATIGYAFRHFRGADGPANLAALRRETREEREEIRHHPHAEH